MITSYERRQQRKDRIRMLYARYYKGTSFNDAPAINAMVAVHGYTRTEILEALTRVVPHVPGEYPVGCAAYGAGRLA